MIYMVVVKWLIPQGFRKRCRFILRNIHDSIRYLAIKRRGLPIVHGHIIFVCKGNICRSSFAEHYFRKFMAASSLIVDSCGLEADENAASPALAMAAALDLGVDLSAHLPKGVSSCDLESVDLIIAMEFDQYRQIVSRYPQYVSKVRLLREFSPCPYHLLCNIDDPYGGSYRDFHLCFSLIGKCILGMRPRFKNGDCNVRV